jgi:hypothetical protein
MPFKASTTDGESGTSGTGYTSGTTCPRYGRGGSSYEAVTIEDF